MTKKIYQRRLASILLILAFALSLAAAFGLANGTHAQEPSPSPTPSVAAVNTVELHQALLDLSNPWTVMCVAAHPDDEDGTTLTVLRRRDGVHTVSLFSTFGEGGQNAVGPELYEELGVIRVHETMMAAQIQGSEPYFLGLKDFGFSKSADEAFKVWGHDEALRRMVLKIRELRPDVIITNHDTTSGHGHHQATGRLIIEAFDAAADAKRFPEQLDKLKPWQARRLFVRGFGAASATATDKTFTTDPNQIDPIRGTSFAEQALAALQQHATQGPWPKSIADLLKARRIEGGKLPPIRYRLLKEAAGTPALPANASTPLAGLELPEAIAAKLEPPKIDNKPLTDFLDRPDRVLAALVDWRAASGRNFVNEIDGVAGRPSQLELAAEDAPRFLMFQSRANRALGIAAGVSLTLNSRAPVLVPGMKATFSIDIANAGLQAVHVDALHFKDSERNVPVETADLLLPDTETVVTVDNATPQNATLTVPNEEHLYDGLFLGRPFSVVAELEIDGAKFSLEAQISREIAPAVEIKKISPSPLVWTPGRRDQALTFTTVVRNNLETPFRGALELTSKALGISAGGTGVTLGANETGIVEVRSHAFPVAATRTRRRDPSVDSNYASLLIEDSAAAMISKRTVPVVFSDARVVSGLRVGYVASFDQTLEQSLAALGVNAKPLNVEAVKSSDLSSFDTIIIDNRGYEAHPELIAANSRLLDFAKAGGTLIVFYHKSNEWNLDASKNRPLLAPYTINLGDERVTDETAPIKFLLPRHPLLNFPNKITQADFANWIQERGLYYPKEWNPSYEPLFATNDPGEAALTGGLLVAKSGKGNYIYTSMVWYRELRAGVPGAYRMFANMISYGHK
ncbi:MAG TPA: PIG-L family deacetylase [Pyrinomonadaceae bacterium]|jgi:LmbE family N-acetylglucosaminyl deacetylase|nr:PIG-L family deacetylase [Pyrinomonadaceae bacterium]